MTQHIAARVVFAFFPLHIHYVMLRLGSAIVEGQWLKLTPLWRAFYDAAMPALGVGYGSVHVVLCAPSRVLSSALMIRYWASR